MHKNDLLRELHDLKGGWKPTDYSERLAIPDRYICIASDAHVPYHDERLLANMLQTCREFEVTSIVWLGDLADMPTYSSWGNKDKGTTFQREKQIIRGVLEKVAELGFKQWWTSGNHEDRLFRKNDFQFGMRELADMVGVSKLIDNHLLVVSDNPTVNAYCGKWMLTHPAQYGSTPLVVPSKLATRYQQHVCSAHAHHSGMTWDETGRFRAVETGGLFKPELHNYIQHRVTAHRAWRQGFVLLLDGVPTIFSPEDFL